MKTVEFQAVSSHQSPRIRATVLGVQVQWRVRTAHRGRPPYTGWICDKHGLTSCQHSDVVEAYLPKSMVELMVRLEGRDTGNGAES